MGRIIYENKIKNIGKNVGLSEEEKMIIFFGDDAPELLKDYCYTIDIKKVKGNIVKNQFISLGDEKFKITSVGEMVERNLRDLGHFTICFNGSREAILPGTMYVEDKSIPSIYVGSCIMIFEE